MVPLSVLGLALPWALVSDIIGTDPIVWQVRTALSLVVFSWPCGAPSRPSRATFVKKKLEVDICKPRTLFVLIWKYTLHESCGAASTNELQHL